MKKKLIAITLLVLTITPCLRGQNKEISQARSYIKSGKDLAKAETMLREVIENDSTGSIDKRVYAYLLQAIEKQYAEGNEKLYLKQAYDTTALFTLTKKLFDVAIQLDSIDAQPDEKGRVKIKYRTKNATMLNTCRPNLFFGGTYHLRKGNYDEAYALFDTYIQCASQPMFAGYDYANSDRRMAEAAYWATYSGSQLNDADKVLKYAEMAEKDTSKLCYVLMYEAEAYQMKDDSDNYIATLVDGFAGFPKFSYFFPRLIDHYTQTGEFEEALDVSNKALEVDSTNILFLYAKSNILLTLGKNDECVDVTLRIVEQNDTLPEAYYNIGMALLNKVLLLEKANDRKAKAEIKRIYEEARPFLEKYRELAPDRKKKWAPALYRIYLNLNMGRQFEEIDKIINEDRQ